MRYIITAVDRHVGAPEHFISALVYCEQYDFKRIPSYYMSCLPELLLTCLEIVTLEPWAAKDTMTQQNTMFVP